MITLTQRIGDTVSHRIQLRWGGRAFVPGLDWQLLFTVKADPDTDLDAAAIFQKTTGGGGLTVNGSTCVMDTVPQDTESATPATYEWDIQATNSGGETRTVSTGTMVLLRDVGRNAEPALDVHTVSPPLLYFSYQNYLATTDDDPVLTEAQWVARLGQRDVTSATTSDGTAALYLDSIRFETTNGGPTQLGEMAWESTDGSIDAMLESGVVVAMGEDLLIRVRNATASPIAKGAALAYDGTQGASGRLEVKPWVGSNIPTAKLFLGFAAAAIPANSNGYAQWFGKLAEINTSGGAQNWQDEQLIYAVPGTSSTITNVAPTSGEYGAVAVVVNAGSGTSGILFIRPTFERATYPPSAHTHVTADITDATSDGQTNPGRLLKTDDNGDLIVENLSCSRLGIIEEAGSATLSIANLTDDYTYAFPNIGGTIMVGANNLSEISSASTALVNLGVTGTGVQSALAAATNATGGLVTFGGNIGAATGTSLTVSSAGNTANISAIAAFNGGNTLLVSGSAGYGYLVTYGSHNLNLITAIGQYPRNEGVLLADTKSITWSSTSTITGVVDTRLSRQAAGTLSVDTTANANGLGSLRLTNLTASGTVSAANGVFTTGANIGAATGTSFAVATNVGVISAGDSIVQFNAGPGGTSTRNILTGPRTALAGLSGGGLLVKNQSGVTAPIECSNLTASGTVSANQLAITGNSSALSATLNSLRVPAQTWEDSNDPNTHQFLVFVGDEPWDGFALERVSDLNGYPRWGGGGIFGDVYWQSGVWYIVINLGDDGEMNATKTSDAIDPTTLTGWTVTAGTGTATLAGTIPLPTGDYLGQLLQAADGSWWRWNGTSWDADVPDMADAVGTLAIANGGTGASSASTARTNLGLGTGDSPTFAGATFSGDVSLSFVTGVTVWRSASSRYFQIWANAAGDIRMGSGNFLSWRSAAVIDSGSNDTSLSRKSGTPGTLMVGNGTANNASGSLELTNLTASGTVSAANLSLTNPLSLANGGTGGTDASTARTNLGLGSNDVVAFAAIDHGANSFEIRNNLNRNFRFSVGNLYPTNNGNSTLGSSDLRFSNIFSVNTNTSGTVTGKSFVEGVYNAGTPAGAGATLSLANGSVQKITLTASTAETITLPAVVAGATLLVEVQQAAGGGGTITFQHADTSSVIWAGNATPTMTSTANAVDVFSFVANAAGTKWRGTAAQNFPS